MNYVAQSRKPNAGALAGALAIPAGVGVALAISLAVTVVVTKPAENPDAINVKVDLPPPPPKPETPDTATQSPQTTAPKPVVPDTPFVITSPPSVATTPISNLRDDLITIPLPSGAGEIVGPPITPVLPDPIAVSPVGNPGSWIQERDYRSNWIRQGLSGVAGFTLKIDARGNVTDCTITRSTGHNVLDGATCRLLTRRARFDPARNSAGEKIAGTYASSVAWEIP